MAPKFDCIERALNSIFYKYGKLVARYPLPFLVVPVIFTSLWLIGTIRFTVEDDTEYLYAPSNGPAKTERQNMRQFPDNQTYYFLPSRKLDMAGTVEIIVQDASRNPNLYTRNGMRIIIDIDWQVRNLTSHISGSRFQYEDICAKWTDDCFQTTFLNLIASDPSAVDTLELTYPFTNNTFLGDQLGGVTTGNDNFINNVEAIKLSYHVQYLSTDMEEKSDQWMTDIIQLIQDYDTNDVIVVISTSKSLDEELQKATTDIIPTFSITYTVLCVFSMFTCMMMDWVRNKAWLALGGQVSAGLAIATSIGILSAVGVPFASICATMPFLIMGIGIDDMFVIIAAWRDTSIRDTTEERMGHTLKLAAVSITLTSITDVLAFGIGAISPFRSVQFFCAYAGVACAFCYIYSITFFAACLVFSGRIEERSLHAATCMRATPVSEAGKRSLPFRIFCTGGEAKDSIVEKKLPWSSELIERYFAPWLMRKPTKCVVLVVYAVYMGIAIWGCVALQQGLELKNLAPDNSYLSDYYSLNDEYFLKAYSGQVLVALDETIDYTRDISLRKIDDLVESFQQNEYYFSGSDYLEFWLYDFQEFMQLQGLEPTNMPQFITFLRDIFLPIPGYERYKLDINFNADLTEITSSRFLIQAKGIEDNTDESEQMTEARRLADESSFDTFVFFYGFIFYDQYTVILSNTLINLGIAVVCVFIVSLCLVPNLIAVIWVTLSIISICVGVIGYMTLWGVSLDAVSMVNLVLCIGFSVDFAAHISYHFTTADHSNGNEKAIEALAQLGTPIIQGALSTILAVSVLSTANAYIFRTFFKIIFLVMVFGFFHAMFLLPVILSSLYNICRYSQPVSEGAATDKNGDNLAVTPEIHPPVETTVN